MLFKNNKIKRKKYGLLTSRRAKIFFACIVALPILNFFVMYVGVNFNSFFLAFQRYDYAKSYEAQDTIYCWNGWNNIRQVWNDFTGKDAVLGKAMINSFWYYIVPTVGTFTWSLWFSYYIAKKMYGAEFFKVTAILVSAITSPFMMSILWLHLCTTAYPALVKLVFGKTVAGLYSKPETILIASIVRPNLFIGCSLLMISLITRVPQSCIEAAKLDGCTPMREFWSITFPLISPTLAMQFVTGIPALFTGQGGLFDYFGEFAPSSAQTLGYILFIKVAGSKASVVDYPYAAAAGMLSTFVAVPLTLGLRYLMKKKLPDVSY